MGPEERANQSVDVVTQLRRTGRFALWIGVFEIVVIPIYYYVAYLIPNITQVVLIGVIAIIGAYQFVTGLILVVQGRKLELASLAQLKTLRRPLRWVTAIVIVFIIFAVVNAIILLTEGASGGAVGILSLLLLGSVSQSRRALKAYEASPDLHLQTTATLDPQPTQPLLVIVIIVTVLVVLGTMIVTLKPKPAQRLVENKAYLAAIKQATNDNADSNQTNNQGPQIVADGQHVLAVARTNQQRSGGEYWVGLGYFWQQDYATALTHEQQSISYDSSNTTAIITSGDLLVNTDQNQAAIAMAERALSLDPKSSSAYRVMAFAESNLGSQAQALADITKATTLDQAAANQGYLASDTQDRNLIDSSNGGKVLFSPN